ncbi:MAG: hypothetical protein LQ350_003083 [Teloschistes chrysophthalmus]|nr:MAG: hypothetical protein LQ350_003083 [Niorma chrysophthalma]
MFRIIPTLLLLIVLRAVRSDVQPAPIVIEPSGNFSGNDGAWGTFNVGVGTPLQSLQLLASTQNPETWVILDEGCVATDPKNCSVTRGGVYVYSNSSSWAKKGVYGLTSESNLGYTQNSDAGAYGWDNVALATPDGADIMLNRSVIAGLATKDFYMGSLGLAARAIEWQDHKSTVTHTNAENAPPSLTLGGYDTSRFTPNDVTFSFSSSPLRRFIVAIQAISVTKSLAESQLLGTGIYTLVDSTVPHIWLPLAACQAFEDAFGIMFDPITNFYIVNDTQHDAMVKQGAEVTFQLGTSLIGGSVINITLPYASFDLEIGPPFTKSPKRYFPLRRAKDETQHTLGRTILQEMFLLVDYDNQQFSLSQAQYTEGAPRHVIATNAKSGVKPSNNSTTSDNPAIVKTSSNSSHGIGTGAIAGIAVGIVVIALLAVGCFFLRGRSRRSKKNKNIKGKVELDGEPEPKGVYEAYGKRRSLVESTHETKKGASIGVGEVSKTPPAELHGDFGGSPNAGTSHEYAGVAELPSPDPFRPELESPGLGIIRSELSTPEPRSELSTADPSLVPELTSRELAHEMSSNRNSQIRPSSIRMDSVESDIISPHDSASIRPHLHGRKNSEDTLQTPVSPQPKRPSIRYSQRRHSGQRPHQIRLHSSSSHDTFQTRFNESASTPQPQPQGSPSPFTSPPLGTYPSPSLSGLNSPTMIPHSRLNDNGPPTPGIDISEKDPLMPQQQREQQQQQFRGRFSENLTSDPEMMMPVVEGRPRSDRSVDVKTEVEKLEDRLRREGSF